MSLMNPIHLALVALLIAGADCRADEPFLIRVLDADTGRGVPLVELETVHHLKFVTDNSGLAAMTKQNCLARRFTSTFGVTATNLRRIGSVIAASSCWSCRKAKRN